MIFRDLAVEILGMDTAFPAVYLSGPMSGLPEFNKKEFGKYAKKYRKIGYKVISPHELGDPSAPYAENIRCDIRAILDNGVKRMYMLPGWQYSKGARLEYHIAELLNLEIYDAETDKPYEETVLDEAKRLVYGDRGSSYGNPFDDFGRTAGMVSALFKSKLETPNAAPFTPEEVAMFMICVKLSREYNYPKRDNTVDIAGYAETLEMVKNERKKRKVLPL